MDRKRLQERSHERKAGNIGLGIFLFILIYIAVSFFLSLRESHPTIYEVQKIALATNNLAQAVVVREEQNVTTTSPGYINYYMKSGTRVAKNETVFSLENSRQIRSSLFENVKLSLSESDVADIKANIESFHKTYESGSVRS